MKGFWGQVNTVPHPELLSLEASQSIKHFVVVVFVLQGFKPVRYFLIFLLLNTSTAATEPRRENKGRLKKDMETKHKGKEEKEK